MRKKIIAGILSAIMATSIFTSCGNANTTGTTTGNTAGATSGEYTELEVWTFVELHQEFYADMVEKWNEQNPDRQVQLKFSNLQYDDMHNKLSLALESGKGAPDVADIEINKFPNFTKGSNIGLMDLSSYVDPYRDYIVSSRLELYNKNGAQYGLPTHVGATVAFYNTEELNAAGINYEEIKTWDQFKEAGVKYHESTGKYFACIETSAIWVANLMLAQKGGDYIDAEGNINLTSDELVEVLTYIKEMQDTGAFATVPGGQPDNDEAYPSYNTGEYAVQIMPFWQTSRFLNYMTDLKGKIAIAPPPVWKEGDIKSIGGGGTGTAVIASGENAELAAEVFSFIKLSKEANEEVWNVLGFDPVNTEVWTETSITQNPENKYVEYFTTYPFDALNKIKDSVGLLKSQSDDRISSINTELSTNTLNNIYENGTDIKTALQTSQENLENEFR